MKTVSFPEHRSRFSDVIRGITVLITVTVWVFGRTAWAGNWTYQAPYSGVGSSGVAPVGGTSQLFRPNMIYVVTPYVPPAQPEQSGLQQALPFIMAGLAFAPLLFSDKGFKSSDAPARNSQTSQRSPAGNQLRKKYVEAQSDYFAAGHR